MDYSSIHNITIPEHCYSTSNIIIKELRGFRKNAENDTAILASWHFDVLASWQVPRSKIRVEYALLLVYY